MTSSSEIKKTEKQINAMVQGFPIPAHQHSSNSECDSVSKSDEIDGNGERITKSLNSDAHLGSSRDVVRKSKFNEDSSNVHCQPWNSKRSPNAIYCQPCYSKGSSNAGHCQSRNSIHDSISESDDIVSGVVIDTTVSGALSESFSKKATPRKLIPWRDDLDFDGGKAPRSKESTGKNEYGQTVVENYGDGSQNHPRNTAVEPQTYFLKCGNMNLQFTDASSCVTLKFISECDEATFEQSAPKEKIPEGQFSFFGKCSATNTSSATESVRSSSDIYRSESTDSLSSSSESDSFSESGRSFAASEGDQMNSYLDTAHHIVENPPHLLTSCDDDNINNDLHFETENIKLDFAPTSTSGTFEINYRRFSGRNRIIFKSNDKKLLLKTKN